LGLCALFKFGISISKPLKDLEAFRILGATGDEVDAEGAPMTEL
jgi:hypothetical protein